MEKKILIGLLIFAAIPSTVNAASFYLTPSSGTYGVGSIITINVYISSTEQAINAASGTISFSKEKLEVVSLSKSGSIFGLWVQEPSFSNAFGIINFEGIVLNPGFLGKSGKVMSIDFRVKSVGDCHVDFSSSSILANDGNGTNILSKTEGGDYFFEQIQSKSVSPISKTPLSPVIYSSTHPDQDKWYANQKTEFNWNIPKDIINVSIFFNNKLNSNPGPISDGLFNSKTYENIEDGIWYFHIKFKNKHGWGPISHYKISIDTKPPLPFTVQIENCLDSNCSSQPILVFEAEDELSGINYYEVAIDGISTSVKPLDNAFSTVFKVPYLSAGKQSLSVRAFDMAGNNTISSREINVIGKSIMNIIKNIFIKHIELLICAGIFIIILIIINILWIHKFRSLKAKRTLKK